VEEKEEIKETQTIDQTKVERKTNERKCVIVSSPSSRFAKRKGKRTNEQTQSLPLGDLVSLKEERYES